MSTVSLVWDDGFGRHREEVTFVNQTSQYKTFKDADGQEFSVRNERIVSLDETLSPEGIVGSDGYQENS